MFKVSKTVDQRKANKAVVSWFFSVSPLKLVLGGICFLFASILTSAGVYAITTECQDLVRGIKAIS